jgi:hypothetical protein
MTDFTKKVDEVDICIFESRISAYLHHTRDRSTAAFDAVHHILRVTLNDNLGRRPCRCST